MGLDMFLRAEKYVSGWKADPDSDYMELAEKYGMTEFLTERSPSAYVTFTVAYWRKANHIHSWFVRNVQDGIDECLPHYVSREQLKELRSQCQDLIAFRARHGDAAAEKEARHRMEPQGGFFFGPTEIGPWYWDELENTVDQLDRVLAIGSDWSIQYRSSW